MSKKPIHRFSDFASDFSGPKLHIEDVLNREITIYDFKIQQSKIKEYTSGEYVIFQIKIDGKSHVLFSSSKVLRSLIIQYKDKLPFTTVITKNKNFYTFS